MPIPPTVAESDAALDLLIDAAALHAELGSHPAGWVVAKSGRLAAVAAAKTPQPPRAAGRKPAPWSPEEEQFLEQHLGILSDADIGAALGRTATAVGIRWKREMGLAAPTRHPDWYTARGVALLLHIDEHSVKRLMEYGLLDGWQLLPWLNQGLFPTYRIPRVRVWRWAVNPAHWIYFRPERVRDPRLRRILAHAVARWPDEWWTPGQVAAYHGVGHDDVNRYIRAGKIPAVQYGNWHILRSIATAPGLHIPKKGKGSGHERLWSESADAFLLLARAIGLSTNGIGALLGGAPYGWRSNSVCYRLERLRDSGAVSTLSTAYGLGISQRAVPRPRAAGDGPTPQDLPRPRDVDRPAKSTGLEVGAGALFADWRQHRRRFPTVARAMDRFATSGHLTVTDRSIVRGVLWAWATWYARTPDQLAQAHTLNFASHATPARLRQSYLAICTWSPDPLAQLDAERIAISQPAQDFSNASLRNGG